MRCAHVDRVLSFALGTLLMCGLINAAVAIIEQTWWTWGVGGACLTAALAVAHRWLRPPNWQRVAHAIPVARPRPRPVPVDRADLDAAA